jgi:hypothetical protein
LFQAILTQASVPGVKTVVVGLKVDLLENREVTSEEAKTFTDKQLQPKPEFVIEVNLLTGFGIADFKGLLKDVLTGTKRSEEPTLNLEAPRVGPKTPRFC